MENVSRRGFVAAGAAAGMAGMLSSMGMVAQAEEAQAAGEQAVALPCTNVKQVGDPSILNEYGQMDPVKFVTDVPESVLLDMLLTETQDVQDYTTPDGTVIPAVYIKLRNRINRYYCGIGAGVGTEANTGHEWDVFMKNWTEEEAQDFLDMPSHQWFTDMDLATVNGKPVEECLEKLNRFANRGLIFRRYVAGVPYFSVIGQLPGYWEIGQLVLANEGKEAEAAQFAVDCDLAMGNNMKYTFDNYRGITRVIPVSKDVVDGELVPYTDWEEHLKRHSSFVVVPCQCRQKKDLIADYLDGEERACRDVHPQDTCLSFGAVADYYKELGIGQELTYEEAVEKVKSNVDLGLIVDAELKRDGGTLCACHGDCCQLLGKMLLMYSLGKLPNQVELMTDYDLAYDTESCIKCGLCAQRCPMMAVAPNDEGYMMANDICVRCGQCALVCPQQARRLKPRELSHTFALPEDSVDQAREMGLIRMALGRIRDFDGTNGDEIYWEPEDIAAGLGNK